jgi:MFS family permease
MHRNGHFTAVDQAPSVRVMTAVAARTGTTPWLVVGQGAAALAAGMGVGRFVYTPILPLMHAQAGLSAQFGATLATANYVGYLAGALAGSFVPGLLRSAVVFRGSMVVLVATLALMPLTLDGTAWFVLRLVAGVASALIFVIAASALLHHLRGHAHHLTGWAIGGVGAGIALSGVLVLVLRSVSTWQAAWWSSAALALVLTVAAWSLRPAVSVGVDAVAGSGATRRWFAWLFTSYSLEGVGYIISGTFLVAAIDQSGPAWLGSGAWVLVGIAALPSAALWAWLSHRWSRPDMLLVALVVQAVGVALPALFGGVAPALLSAFLFGGTFLGVAAITLAIGTDLRVPRAVALLTAGYGVGQIVGPLIVTPLVRNGYHQALLVGAAIVVASAVAAAALRVRFPHQYTGEVT